jgi:hypothetical protein
MAPKARMTPMMLSMSIAAQATRPSAPVADVPRASTPPLW